MRTRLSLLATQCRGLGSPRRYYPYKRLLATVVQKPPEIKLRYYQEECIQAVLSYLNRGEKRLGVSLATGAGKTIIFTHLIERVRPHIEDATQTLILVHRRELVEQAARHCVNAYPSASVDIEMGNLHASGVADITVASVRSMTSGDRLMKFKPERFKLILVDEAHHIVASSYLEILEHFGLMKPATTSPALVGVSATFSRFDGLKLGSAIDHIVYHRDYVDMIGEKWLSDVRFTTVASKADLSKVKKAASGDFQSGSLSNAVNTDETNEITVRAWLARAGERKSTLVFCVDLAHVTGLTEEYRRHGIDARFITGDTPRQTRSTLLEAFRNKEYPVLLNCSVFTEGTDIPNIDCVLLARPTRSRNLLVQMIGRGMRLDPSKANCHVIDMVSSLETGIATVPTLFGLDPHELVDEASVEEMKARLTTLRSEAAEADEGHDGSDAAGDRDELSSDASITFTDYESIDDLLRDSRGEKHIRQMSQFAWVRVGYEHYVLMNEKNEYITVQGSASKDGPRYVIKYNPRVFAVPLRKGEWRPYQKTREVGKAETFMDAVHAADTLAAEKFPRYMILNNVAWRKAAPTTGQLEFLKKLGHDELAESAGMTKGFVTDVITKIKFGAAGLINLAQAARKRIQKAKEKELKAQRLKDRENVRIGPLADRE